MTPNFARKLNILFIFMICTPLIGAYSIQFFRGEFPCPLCLLQRLAMVGIACGAMMNLRYGIRPMHYGMCIISAVLGACISTRQVLLHIVPGPENTGYGSPVMGWHLYTWALLIFMATILILGVLFLFDKQFESKEETQKPRPVPLLGSIAFWLAFGITAANVCTTFLECGIGQCPDNPVSYLLLQ
ncbi:MAG: disulfide bond formation protein DsbB [Phycisphaerales bacterium]|jgi:disulfide bond formation protein DsbB